MRRSGAVRLEDIPRTKASHNAFLHDCSLRIEPGRCRHLDESQRAMVAAKLANRTVGRYGQGRSSNSANLQNKTTVAKAARTMNVSPRSVEAAKKVLKEGGPGLVAAVVSGAMSCPARCEARMRICTNEKGARQDDVPPCATPPPCWTCRTATADAQYQRPNFSPARPQSARLQGRRARTRRPSARRWRWQTV